MRSWPLMWAAVGLVSGAARAQSLDVDAGAVVTLSGSAVYQDVTVESGATLVLNGTLYVDGGLTVMNGGTLTQSAGNTALVIDAPNGTVNVQTFGKIDLTGLGLLGGGRSGNPFGCDGQSIDPVTKFVVAGATGGNGASYGGLGSAPSNPLYGSETDVQYLGSGGGCGPSTGGNGGGYVRIDANALVLDGVIQTDGTGFNVCCSVTGSGSGGSIAVTVGTLSGAGVMSANGGGSGSPYAGNGGGGRVLVSYGSSTFSGTFRALGAGLDATPGSINVHDLASPPNIVVGAGEHHISSGTYASVTVLPGGILDLDGPVTINQPLAINAGARVNVTATNALSNVMLPTQVDGTLAFIASGLAWPGTHTLTGTFLNEAPATSGGFDIQGTGALAVDAKLVVIGDITLSPGGLISHSQAMAGMDLQVSGMVTVPLGATIDVTAKGLLGGGQHGNSFACDGQAIDPQSRLVVAGAPGAVGGSFGGLGALSGANPVYGGQADVQLIGSGGGCGGGRGGNGGGLVRLTAGTLQLDGELKADGENVAQVCCTNEGGGSGGGVWLSLGTLAGIGVIEANGGSPANGMPGGGGGGRVQISYAQSTYTGTFRALGGSPGGQAGSVAVTNTTLPADIIVSGGSYHLTTGDSVRSVTLESGGVLDIDGSAVIQQPLLIVAGSSVFLNAGTSEDNVLLPSHVEGTLAFNSNGLAWPGSHTTTGNVWFKQSGSMGPLDIQPGGKLTVDARVQVSGDVTIENGGALAPSQGSNGMDLRVAGTLGIPQGSSLDATAAGLLGGGQSGNAFGCNGQALDPNTKFLISGAGQGSGGSFGGDGGSNTNAPYGSATDVQYVGSGGGCGGGRGGNGGGLVRVTAQTLQVDGALRSNGETPPAACCTPEGGGSGGGLYLVAGTLGGAGTIEANGGGAGGAAGGGGAGRIEILASNDTFTGVLRALGGAGATPGTGTTPTVSSFAGTPPQIISSPNTSALVNAPWQYDSSGQPSALGSSPITWSLDLTPPGASINSGTGAITWTPSGLGTANFTLRATNTAGSDTQSFTVTIASSPKIVSTAATTGTVGMPYHYAANDTVAVTGSSPFTYAMTMSPPGNPPMQIDAFGTLTWTPVSQGTFNACIQVTNPVGSDSQCFAVQVSNSGGSAPRISSPCVPLATVGVAYPYVQATATGTAPITWSLDSEPMGMSVAPAGALSWTPATSGGAEFVLRATNGAGAATQDCVVTVQTSNHLGPPVILRDANPLAAVGVPYAFSQTGVIQSDGDAPITFAKTSGPTNLTIDATTGQVGWVPTQAGPATVTVTADNAKGQDSYTFTVNVSGEPGLPPVAVIAGGPFTGATPLAASFDGSQSTGVNPILSWSWDFGDGSAPETGAMAQHNYGACGGYVARLTVTDVYGQTAVASQSIQVDCNGQVPPVAKILLTGVVGNGSLQASFACACQQGTAPIVGYQWLASDGFFSDLPSDTHTFPAGGYTLQLIVVDANGLTGVDRQAISVAMGNVTPPFATAHALPTSGTAPVSITFSADYGDTGGMIASTQWAFADGTTSATPVTTRNYAAATRERATFTVTNTGGLSTSSFVDVVISSASGDLPPEFLSVPRTSIFGGEPYTYNKEGLPTVRGTGPFTFKLNQAPSGATVDGPTGKITWTPALNLNATESFALEVDGKAGSAVQTWQVNVVALAAQPKGCHCGSAGAEELFGLFALLPLLRRLRSRRRG